MMKMFAPDQIGAEDVEAMDGIKAIAGNLGNSFVGTGEIDETNTPTLVFKLSREHMRVSEVGDLEGEVTVFGTVARRWPENESYPILAVPGLGMISRKERREMQKSGKSSEPDDANMMMPGPGATLSVVAIFRS